MGSRCLSLGSYACLHMTTPLDQIGDGHNTILQGLEDVWVPEHVLRDLFQRLDLLGFDLLLRLDWFRGYLVLFQ